MFVWSGAVVGVLGCSGVVRVCEAEGSGLCLLRAGCGLLEDAVADVLRAGDCRVGDVEGAGAGVAEGVFESDAVFVSGVGGEEFGEAGVVGRGKGLAVGCKAENRGVREVLGRGVVVRLVVVFVGHRESKPWMLSDSSLWVVKSVVVCAVGFDRAGFEGV